MNSEERFQRYYGEYASRMYQIAGMNGIPYDETEDLLQETFLSFYIHYSGNTPERLVRPLLSKIMRNLCIDYWRKKENRMADTCGPEDMIRLLNNQSKMIGRDTLDIVIENQLFEDWEEALYGMRDEWKRVYIQYEVFGKSMDEISKMLGISKSACHMRNMRGKRYLAQCLKEKDRLPV